MNPQQVEKMAAELTRNGERLLRFCKSRGWGPYQAMMALATAVRFLCEDAPTHQDRANAVGYLRAVLRELDQGAPQ